MHGRGRTARVTVWPLPAPSESSAPVDSRCIAPGASRTPLRLPPAFPSPNPGHTDPAAAGLPCRAPVLHRPGGRRPRRCPLGEGTHSRHPFRHGMRFAGSLGLAWLARPKTPAPCRRRSQSALHCPSVKNNAFLQVVTKLSPQSCSRSPGNHLCCLSYPAIHRLPVPSSAEQ